jgi:predicted RNase H-like HicB family nuclease
LLIFEYEVYSSYRERRKCWFVGQVEELPAAMSQGKTIEALKENLLDALTLLLNINNIAPISL